MSDAKTSRDLHSQLQRRYANLCKAAGVTPFQKLLACIDDERVELRGQRIGGLEAMTCLTALQTSVSLRSLTLEFNELGDAGAGQVAQFLRETVSLTELDRPYLQRIRENQIGPKGLQSITDALVSNQTVSIVDLSANQFDHHCGKYIRRLLEGNEKMTELVLSSNQFDSAGTIDIAYGLAHNRRLLLLDLSWNQIRSDGAICLCDSLGVNEELETVLLANNGLGVQGCKSLAKSLVRNHSVQVLDLSSNRIDARCIEFLLKGLAKNSCLKSLKLSQNPLPVDVVNAFLVEVEKLGLGLQSLDISGLTVDQETMRLANSISSARSFSLLHGPVLRSEGKLDDDQKDLNDDPMTMLMEFLRLKNLRLMDFFMSLDVNNTRSVSCKKFKDGLVNLGLPASPQCLQAIVFILDRDADGQIDISELMGGMRSYKRKMHRVQAAEKHLPYAETLSGRVTLKLESAMEARRKHQAVQRERTTVVAAAAKSTG